jgi:hypothetical protein
MSANKGGILLDSSNNPYGTGIRVTNNTISGTNVAALILDTDTRGVGNITVTGNRLVPFPVGSNTAIVNLSGEQLTATGNFSNATGTGVPLVNTDVNSVATITI